MFYYSDYYRSGKKTLPVMSNYDVGILKEMMTSEVNGTKFESTQGQFDSVVSKFFKLCYPKYILRKRT